MKREFDIMDSSSVSFGLMKLQSCLKIPPNPPFSKGGTADLSCDTFYPALLRQTPYSPLRKRGVRGDFLMSNSRYETFCCAIVCFYCYSQKSHLEGDLFYYGASGN